MELEGRARRTMGTAGYFERGGHCFFGSRRWRRGWCYNAVGANLFLVRVDGVRAGATMLLVLPLKLTGATQLMLSQRFEGFERMTNIVQKQR